jgi:cyclophilin family peptidyl-prolyl cis-trans isomerase
VSKQSKRERQRLNREARREYEAQIMRRRRTMRMARYVVPVAVVAVGAAVVLSTTGGGSGSNAAADAGCREVASKPAPKTATYPSAPPLSIDPSKTYTALVDTSCGSFTIQLDASEAPQTVNSFVYLSKLGFYDGLTFHRVVKNFVVQGGDPKGDGSGGPGYSLPDEPPASPYQKGSVAMANSGPGTTGSQFYIVTTDKGAAALNSQLNSAGKYSYSILGQVTDGFETIVRINKLGSTSADLNKQQPKAIVVVDKITISEGTPGSSTTTGAPTTTTTGATPTT